MAASNSHGDQLPCLQPQPPERPYDAAVASVFASPAAVDGASQRPGLARPRWTHWAPHLYFHSTVRAEVNYSDSRVLCLPLSHPCCCCAVAYGGSQGRYYAVGPCGAVASGAAWPVAGDGLPCLRLGLAMRRWIREAAAAPVEAGS